jgi:hypothetical protein
MNLFTAMLTMLALLASASTEAQTLVITRGGSRSVSPAPAENFTGRVRVEALFEALDPSRQWRVGHVRAQCPDGVALASPRSDPDRHGRYGPGPAMGWRHRGDSSRRRRQDPGR